ncbi:MAG: hypothetical protein GY749_41965 [Desulfobacteraceae bacterium]|nr:hypothetical protein [Desulfobacteraceae bacterium]
MKEQIDILVKLQKIETEINTTKSMLDNVPQKINLLDAKLGEFEQIMADEGSQLDEMKKKYRSHNSDVEANLSTIKKNQERLQAVKSNKEYQALLKGIEELKKQNSKIEDEMIQYLERMEETEKNIRAREDEYTQLKSRTDKEKKAIEKKAADGKKRLASLDTNWDKVSKNVGSGLLEKFVTIKSQGGGIALVPVKDAVCCGCNMNIPAQMYNELQRLDSLRHCPHCHRMIYYEGKLET